MFNTLFGRISLAVLAIFIFLSVLLVSRIDDSAQQFQEEATQKLYLDLAKNIVSDSPLWQEGNINTQSIEDAFHMMMLLGPTIELYIVSLEGRLLNYSDPDGTVVRENINMVPVNNFLNDSSVLPIRGDDPRSQDTQKIFSVSPIYESYVPAELEATTSPVAYLYIILGGENYDSVVDMVSSSYIARIGFATITLGIVLFLLVVLLLFFYLTRPIRKLSGAMTEFRNSDFLLAPNSLPARNPDSKNELHQLIAIFNEMADRIVFQFEEMIKNKNLRQELVSHISHDLKTPLASVKGYLESWQINRDTMSDEEAAKCIDIAVKNCVQLERLVDQLFELSRLEAQEIKPHLEDFPLGELVEDNIQKLNLKATEQNVQIRCSMSEDLPFVRADIGQINRVIINLLDNAIRHSSQNSQVVISLDLNTESDCIDVKVIDSGSGIPAGELEQLFEPYFKASNQDQHYQQGTGLGLAITKRLLALHGVEIKVQSTEQTGSVFYFSLPVAKPESE